MEHLSESLCTTSAVEEDPITNSQKTQKGSQTAEPRWVRSLPQTHGPLVLWSLAGILVASHRLSIFSHHLSPTLLHTTTFVASIYLYPPFSCFSLPLLPYFVLNTAPSLLLWGQVSLDSQTVTRPLYRSADQSRVFDLQHLWIGLISTLNTGILSGYLWVCRYSRKLKMRYLACRGTLLDKLLMDISASWTWKLMAVTPACKLWSTDDFKEVEALCLYSSVYWRHLKYLHPLTKLGFARNI